MADFFDRILNLSLPKHQSAFLWGARKTGKTTYLKRRFPDAYRFDLLHSDVYLKFLKTPSHFREEIHAQLSLRPDYPIFVVDEVQKVPLLLDEIHSLIEETHAQFILCGSSARKLRAQGMNLLGGRAWKYHFFPLVYPEIKGFNLLRALKQGLIPSHYQSERPKKFLQAYVEDYMIQEIQAEGLVKDLGSFSRFFEAMSFSNAEMVNCANIARDCGVDAKTVKSYCDILKDTLMAYLIDPYVKIGKRKVISSAPKFYFFDPAVSNFLSKRNIETLSGHDAGKSLENYIVHEVLAYRSLKEKDFSVHYWRTKTGLEVDLVLHELQIAIEVKISKNIHQEDLKGLKAFMEDHPTFNGYLICLTERPRKIILETKQEIWIAPVEFFLEQLWSDRLSS